MTSSAVSTLWRSARKLRSRRRGAKRPPPLLLFTDPVRVPDPVAAARRLPRGAGVVFRPFGEAEALAKGPALAKLCRQRGLILLAGADVRLAIDLGADGVHLPERQAGRFGDIVTMRRRFIITAAAHSLPAALAARRAGVEAIVVSPVFESASPSAIRPLGVMVLSRITRAARLPVYALGGVNARTARVLGLSGISGLAAIEALSEPRT